MYEEEKVDQWLEPRNAERHGWGRSRRRSRNSQDSDHDEPYKSGES